MDTEQEIVQDPSTEAVENQDSKPDEELETSKQEETSEVEDVETLKQRLADTEKKNKELYARLKKTPKAPQPQTNSQLTREEAILFAKGYTEEEVALANKIAKVGEVSTLVASEDPYFKAKVEERKQKEKSAQASLGASGGANKFTPKDIGKMSREEHEKLYYQTMGIEK